MLQWMGGSRRKVATSGRSTQKRQKQYFEQRKRQQQNFHMAGSDNHAETSGISGKSLKEHRSLDILNLLNLSKYAQECNSFCPKGKDDGVVSPAIPGNVSTNQPIMLSKVETTVSYGFEEEKEENSLYCQIETSPKRVLTSAPDHQNTAFGGPSSHWKTPTDRYSELSVIDLLCDDEPDPTEEKYPSCEDHVSFSLEGLGKIGIQTPTHSPLRRMRMPYRNSTLPKGGRKTKLKNLNHVLDDIELEVDEMMQDIGVSPVNSSNFPSNKVKQSSEIDEDCRHFCDHSDKNRSSIGEEFFYQTEKNEDMWNASSIFDDDEFHNEMGYYTSCKKTFQLGHKSPELLKSGAYKMGNYACEDLPTKWSSETVMKEINMGSAAYLDHHINLSVCFRSILEYQ